MLFQVKPVAGKTSSSDTSAVEDASAPRPRPKGNCADCGGSGYDSTDQWIWCLFCGGTGNEPVYVVAGGR